MSSKLPSACKIAATFLLVLLIAELFSRWLLTYEYVQQNLFNGNTYSRLVGWVYTRPDLQTHRYTIDVFDSITGWSTKPQCNKTPYSGGTFSSDSFGVRINPHSSEQHDSSAVRIMTVGDSFTFGEEESDENTYPAIMEDMLPNCKIYNIGVHGYGIDQMLLHLKKHIRRVKPQIVVFSFIAQDVDRATSSFTNYLKPLYLRKQNDWVLTNYPVPQPDSILKKYSFHSAFALLLNLIASRTTNSYDHESIYNTDPNERTALAKNILNEVNKEIVSAGAISVYCLIPYPNSYFDPYVKQLHPYWQNTTKKICKEMSAHFFSLDSCFETKVDVQHLEVKEGHWKKKHNAFIAECIAGYLKKEILLMHSEEATVQNKEPLLR